MAQEQRSAFNPSEVTEAVTNRDPECIDVMDPKSHYDVLARILLLYAKLNRGVRYVQGMNELLAPLYYLFAQDPLNSDHAEDPRLCQADTFFCFSLLMSDMRDAFVKTMDNEEGGMMGRIDKFSALLKEKDEEVWSHLEELHVAPVYYTELDMADVLRLWDSLLSESLSAATPWYSGTTKNSCVVGVEFVSCTVKVTWPDHILFSAKALTIAACSQCHSS
eukprot:Skav206017  [mRNA]  locus=scaffold3015:66498:67989:+ [translate_table: standard]